MSDSGFYEVFVSASCCILDRVLLRCRWLRSIASYSLFTCVILICKSHF